MDFWDSLIRMVSALAVVLGLMSVFAVIARRMVTARSLGHAGVPLVQVLGTGYLGPRKSISLVAVAGEFFVIGTTSTDLIPLGRISDPEQIRRLAPAGSKVEAEVKAKEVRCSTFEA